MVHEVANKVLDQAQLERACAYARTFCVNPYLRQYTADELKQYATDKHHLLTRAERKSTSFDDEYQLICAVQKSIQYYELLFSRYVNGTLALDLELLLSSLNITLAEHYTSFVTSVPIFFAATFRPTQTPHLELAHSKKHPENSGSIVLAGLSFDLSAPKPKKVTEEQPRTPLGQRPYPNSASPSPEDKRLLSYKTWRKRTPADVETPLNQLGLRTEPTTPLVAPSPFIKQTPKTGRWVINVEDKNPNPDDVVTLGDDKEIDFLLESPDVLLEALTQEKQGQKSQESLRYTKKGRNQHRSLCQGCVNSWIKADVNTGSTKPTMPLLFPRLPAEKTSPFDVGMERPLRLALGECQPLEDLFPRLPRGSSISSGSFFEASPETPPPPTRTLNLGMERPTRRASCAMFSQRRTQRDQPYELRSSQFGNKPPRARS